MASSTTSTGKPSLILKRKAQRSQRRWSPSSTSRVRLGSSGQRRMSSSSLLIMSPGRSIRRGRRFGIRFAADLGVNQFLALVDREDREDEDDNQERGAEPKQDGSGDNEPAADAAE